MFIVQDYNHSQRKRCIPNMQRLDLGLQENKSKYDSSIGVTASRWSMHQSLSAYVWRVGSDGWEAQGEDHDPPA